MEKCVRHSSHPLTLWATLWNCRKIGRCMYTAHRKNFETNNGCNLNFNYSEWLVNVKYLTSIDIIAIHSWKVDAIVGSMFKALILHLPHAIYTHTYYVHHQTKVCMQFDYVSFSAPSARLKTCQPRFNHLLFTLNWISKWIEFEKRGKKIANRLANQKFRRTIPTSVIVGTTRIVRLVCQFQLSSGT